MTRELPPCPRCKERTVRCGVKVKAGGKFQRYLCTGCGHTFTAECIEPNTHVTTKRVQVERPPCPRCGEAEQIVASGKVLKPDGPRQRFTCKKCAYNWAPA